MRVVVAMSGGVDSSAVAALLKEQGHDVMGRAMKTHSSSPKANRACCTPDDMRDARKVADLLDIPFYVLNYEKVFEEEIIKPFAEAYLSGKTPNPCVDCNYKVKFRPLLERARLLGAEKLATGHYARIDQEGDLHRLRRGVDAQKDQSYFLYRLHQEQLQELWFPLGGMNKAEVREHARRLGLPLADKQESQEICFVGAEGYAATVEKISGRRGKAGRLVDPQGKTLGVHEGIHRYTIGQRRGLGIAASHPLYVTEINPESGDITVGPVDGLLTEFILVENVIWLGKRPEENEELLVQQRYRGKPQRVRVGHKGDGRVKLSFVEPEPAGAAGQAAVIYRDDAVVGGGVISPRSAHRALPLLQGVG